MKEYKILRWHEQSGSEIGKMSFATDEDCINYISGLTQETGVIHTAETNTNIGVRDLKPVGLAL